MATISAKWSLVGSLVLTSTPLQIKAGFPHDKISGERNKQVRER